MVHCLICKDQVHARKLCMNHYAKFRRGTLSIETPLTKHDDWIGRFWENILKHKSGCWFYQSKSTFHFGYGRIQVNGKPARAHRVSWQLHHGKIPRGKNVYVINVIIQDVLIPNICL